MQTVHLIQNFLILLQFTDKSHSVNGSNTCTRADLNQTGILYLRNSFKCIYDLYSNFQSHEVRLADLARGFEEATIDKNEQEEKTISMKKKLETAAQLRRVCQLVYGFQVHKKWYPCILITPPTSYSQSRRCIDVT